MRTRLIRDEGGMALIMALGVMMVLTILLTSVIFLTSSSARDAHRTNASQRAYSLAEAGISNALSVLNANYPTVTPFPGDYTLLSGAGLGEAGCPCTTTYSTGSVVWNGSLVPAPPTANWTYEWDLTATGSVANPTGPTASPVTRRATAVVPVVIPDTTSIDPRKNSLNWIYGFNVTFNNQVIVAAPVFAAGDLNLGNPAVISETIPATPGNAARPNSVVVAGNVLQANTGSNQNHIGHVNGVVDPPTSPNNDVGDVHIGGQCSVGSSGLHACAYGTNGTPGDWIFAATHDTVTSNVVDPPTFTCCASGEPQTVTGAPPVDLTHPDTQSDMGFWYNHTDFGPSRACATYATTGTIATPLHFDSASASPTTLARDGIIDQSAYAGAQPFNLTPSGAGYDCRSADGTKQFSWNGTTAVWNGIPKNTLIVRSTIFIDGSVTSTASQATYLGTGALILSGTFRMANGNDLCVNANANGTCNQAATWDPNIAGMFIFAAGDFGTERSLQQTNSLAGESIDMKSANFQGGLYALKDLNADVSGTRVEGPLISAYGNVTAGESTTLSFPPISFPSSGTDGFTGPFPIARILAPRQFGGS